MLDENGTPVKDEGEVCKLFAEHFARNHSLTLHTKSTHENKVDDFVNEFHSRQHLQVVFSPSSPALPGVGVEFDPLLFTPDEVKETISSRNNSASVGTDSMPNRILKLLDERIITALTVLFNHLVASGSFPGCWKNAIVVPIPKPGKNNKIISNWRPISLLPCLSKIFERLIAKRIRSFCSNNKVIPAHQFGFMSSISTSHPLAILQNRVCEGLNSGLITTSVFLDIRAAFDTVWHRGLMYKLGQLKFPVYLMSIIFNFLNNRTFRVKIGSALSDAMPIPAGVPQGSVLGPILFNISMVDIPTNPNAFLLQYADDTSISFYHSSIRGVESMINNHLSELCRWYTDWKFLLNADKTELIHFVGSIKHISSNRRKGLKRLKLVVNNKILIPSSSVIYLGLVLTSSYRFNKHLDHIINKVRTAKLKLFPLMHNQLIDVKFKRFLYSVYLRPILTYACPVWLTPSNISSFQVEKLRRIERQLIRITHNIYRPRNTYRFLSNQELYKIFSYNRIDVHMAKLSLRFHERCLASSHPLIIKYINRYSKEDAVCPNVSNFVFTNYIFNLNERDWLFRYEDALTIFNRRRSSPVSLIYSVAQ